jgi:2Fe-2S ferredoxin
MPVVRVITRDGREHTLEAQSGLSLMEIIRNAGIEESLGLCGGCCSCATCHVQFDGEDMAKLPAILADEDDLLDASSYRSSTSRLACQVRLTAELDGVSIKVAPEE